MEELTRSDKELHPYLPGFLVWIEFDPPGIRGHFRVFSGQSKDDFGNDFHSLDFIADLRKLRKFLHLIKIQKI